VRLKKNQSLKTGCRDTSNALEAADPYPSAKEDGEYGGGWC
jgi:hypothetical protein